MDKLHKLSINDRVCYNFTRKFRYKKMDFFPLSRLFESRNQSSIWIIIIIILNIGKWRTFISLFVENMKEMEWKESGVIKGIFQHSLSLFNFDFLGFAFEYWHIPLNGQSPTLTFSKLCSCFMFPCIFPPSFFLSFFVLSSFSLYWLFKNSSPYERDSFEAKTSTKGLEKYFWVPLN